MCPPVEAPVSGVFCTGRGVLERVSQRRTCPLYEPPTTREGWNGENFAVRMSEVLWKVYSGREWRCRFHTWSSPDGSCGADGFFVYDANRSSGNYAFLAISTRLSAINYLGRKIQVANHSLLVPPFVVELSHLLYPPSFSPLRALITHILVVINAVCTIKSVVR